MPPQARSPARRLTSGRLAWLASLACALACGPQDGATSTPSTESASQASVSSESTGGAGTTEATTAGQATRADVLDVTSSGDPGSYTFAVTVESPDAGCERYADWWEVVTPDGLLLYRRVLAHSHVDEQPFTRQGGPVTIAPDDVVVVRAHMSPGGYGGQVLRGSINGGFQPAPELREDFAESLETSDPLPGSCQF